MTVPFLKKKSLYLNVLYGIIKNNDLKLGKGAENDGEKENCNYYR